MSDSSLGDLGTASIAIKTDISAFMRDIKLAQNELKKLEDAAKPPSSAFTQMFNKGKEAASGMKESFIGAKEAVEAFVAAMAVEKLYELVKGSLEWAQSLKDLSEQTGLTTTKIQELQYRALAFGITTQELTTGLDFFSKSFGSFLRDQSGPGAKAFADIGTKAAITSGQVQTTGEGLDFVLDKLSKMKNINIAGADAAGFFGRQLGVRIVPMARQAADEVARLNSEAAKLGFIVKPETVEEMAQANVKLETLFSLTKRDFASEVGKLAPTIASLTSELIADMPALTNWIDHWLTLFGIIDQHSMASLDAEIADTQKNIANLVQEKKDLEGGFGASLIKGVSAIPGLGPVIGGLFAGADLKGITGDLDAAKKKLAALQDERKKLNPKDTPAGPLTPTAQMMAFDDAINKEKDKIGELIDQRAALSKTPAGAARDSAFAAETKAIVAEQAQLAKLQQQKTAYLNLHPELKLSVGASKEDKDAAKKLAEEANKVATERATLAEKITAYDAAMTTADQKASKDMIAAQDAAAVKSAQNSNNKIAEFVAQMKAAKDAAAAETAVIQAEGVQQQKALEKLNQEYRKLTAEEYAVKHHVTVDKVTPDYIAAHGQDLPDLSQDSDKIEKETKDRVLAVDVKAQSDQESLTHDKIEYESQAAYQIRDLWISSINDSFTAFENFVENGGSAMQALSDLAKQVANDIFNTFLRLSVENPLLNMLYGGQPGYNLLPTLGVGGNGYGSGGALGGLANWLGLGSDSSGGLFGAGGALGSGGFFDALLGGTPIGQSTVGISQAFADSNVGTDFASSFDLSGLAADLPQLADGGPVSSGDTYLVGEQGPELFVSDRAGQIVPNGQLGSIGGGDTHVHFHGITDAPSIFRAQSQIEAMVTRAASRGQRGL